MKLAGRKALAACPAGNVHHWLMSWEHQKYWQTCIKCGERRQADENLGHGTVDHIGKRKRNRNQTVWLPGSHEHILEG